MQTLRFFIFFTAGLLLACTVSLANVYYDEQILKIEGFVSGEKQSVALDLSSIDKMPQTSISTSTPWHPGVNRYSGVRLKDFLTAMKLTGDKLQIIALNDYEVEASIPDLVEADALLATRENGEVMPVSDKGPVFLVFPFDSRPELQHQKYYSRAVWQIAEMNVR